MATNEGTKVQYLQATFFPGYFFTAIVKLKDNFLTFSHY
jgi:hypothetical protein